MLVKVRPEILGSLDDYLAQNELEDSPEAHQEYSTALHGLRIARAEELGITLDELHTMRFPLSSLAEGTAL